MLQSVSVPKYFWVGRSQSPGPAANGVFHHGGREDAEGGGLSWHAEWLPERSGTNGSVRPSKHRTAPRLVCVWLCRLKLDFQRGSANSWILNCPVARSLYFYRDEESVKRYGNKDKEFLASTKSRAPTRSLVAKVTGVEYCCIRGRSCVKAFCGKLCKNQRNSPTSNDVIWVSVSGGWRLPVWKRKWKSEGVKIEPSDLIGPL